MAVCIAALLVAGGEASALTSRGEVRALVVFSRFQDESGNAAPDFAADLFDPGRPGSLTHFYREMSRGQFNLSGEALARRYATLQPAANYAAEGDASVGQYGDFAREILLQVDQDVDLGQYDNDGPDGVPNSGDDDGMVDFVFINTLTTPPGFIVGGATGIAGLGLNNDFVSSDRTLEGRFIRVRRDNHEDGPGGTLQRGHTFALAVGTMAHEFGHILGLPDLFDTDINTEGGGLDPEEDGAGIGHWGLMGNGARGWDEGGGPNPFCAWSLEQLGWLGADNADLVVLEEDAQDVVFEDVNAGGKVYKMPLRAGEVYYLVEHRRRAGSYYERDLPAEGLLIWRINPTRLNNNGESDKLVDLVSADGLYSDAGFPQGQNATPDFGRDNLDFWAHDENYSAEYAGNLGDATDVYDGLVYRDFSAVSNPASPPGISVGNIRSQGESMLADLSLTDRRRAGVVAGEEVWRDTIEGVGDVLVQGGARLAIEPGTVVLFGRDQRGGGSDPERCELIVQGVLRAGFLRSQQIVLRSAAAQPQPGDWHGIRVALTGRLILNQILLEHAVEGLSGSGLLQPQDLEGTVIRRSVRDGIHFDDIKEPVMLDGVVVEGAGGAGGHIAGRGIVRVFNSRFADNAGSGLERSGGFIDCRENSFAGNGLELDGAANLVLGDQVFGNVFDNVLQGGVGVRCDESGTVLIEDNEFDGSSIGLLSISALPQIVGNTFVDNELAIRIAGFGVPSKLELNGVFNAARLVENAVEGEVQAINNWWGRDDEAWIAARISGPVAWRPFLNFDPRLPVGFDLAQNYPNPFNGSTVINFSVGINAPVIAGRSMMKVEVRTITGALVRRLIEQEASPGFYSVVWDGHNDAGVPAASGVYYYQLRVGPIAVLKRLLLIK